MENPPPLEKPDNKQMPMDQRHLTLRDLAKTLQLSTSTVSKALRDSHEISVKTKEKVISYAKQVGYQPNVLAKSLKEGRTNTLGVVICSLDNSFVSELLNGVDQICRQRGYSLMIMQSQESHLQEIQCMEVLYRRSIDGLLISPACEIPDIEHLKNYQQRGVPMVFLDRYVEELDIPKIGIDNQAASYRATEHLIQHGYRQIAVLHSNTSLNIHLQRLAGYKQALLDYQIEVREDYIKPCDFGNAHLLEQSIRHAVQSLMALPHPPKAIFAASDQITTCTMVAIQSLGYRIPEDLGLIGFTNTTLAPYLAPPLSTIAQPAKEMGQAAAQTLINLIQGIKEADIPHASYFETTLYARKSSAPLFTPSQP